MTDTVTIKPKTARKPTNHKVDLPAKVKEDCKDYEWRTGRHRTWQAKLIYAQLGDEPSNGDILIGQMATPKLAKQAVDEHNGWFD